MIGTPLHIFCFRYDGTAANNLPWAGGSPRFEPAEDMVYVFDSYGLYEGTAGGGQLTCKTPAARVGYDPTAKFI